MKECLRCADYIEEDQLCYVCFQQLKKQIDNLKNTLVKLTEENLILTKALRKRHDR